MLFSYGILKSIFTKIITRGTEIYSLISNFFFLLISNNLKSQNSCFYVEENSISEGSICIKDTLHFTSNIETLIIGEISANKVIIITPTGFHDIILRPSEKIPCEDCVEGEGGTTIRTKDRTSGGKDKKASSESNKITESKISLKKNPVKDILELSVSKNINISNIEIYDSAGKRIKTSATHNKDYKINCSDFPNGKYWILINTIENKKYILNFIKN